MSVSFVNRARALGEYLADLREEIPEPTCSQIDSILRDIAEPRKLADRYSRNAGATPIEDLMEFPSLVGTALWSTPEELEALRHANAQLRDAVCRLGSRCHEAGRLLLEIALEIDEPPPDHPHERTV